MTKALGWEKFQSADDPHLFTLPETTLGDSPQTLKKNSASVPCAALEIAA